MSVRDESFKLIVVERKRRKRWAIVGQELNGPLDPPLTRLCGNISELTRLAQPRALQLTSRDTKHRHAATRQISSKISRTSFLSR
jgi:hypothetical protein